MNRTKQDLRAATRQDVWPRIRVGLYAAALALLIYGGIMFIEPGMFTYLLTLPAAGIILITSWARINDLSIDMAGTAWNVRRAGLVLVSLFACGVAVWPFLYGTWTPWLVVFGVWGFAMTWLTTPHQPPWKTYIFGDYINPEYRTPERHRRNTDDFDSNP